MEKPVNNVSREHRTTAIGSQTPVAPHDVPEPSAAASYRRWTSRRRTLIGIGLAIVGAASASTKGIAIKLALAQGVDITTTMAWRMIIAVPIFLVLGCWQYLRSARQRPSNAAPLLTARTVAITAALGLTSTYGAAFLDFSALSYISAQLDRLLLLTYPFFVVLIGVALFGRRLTLPIVASLIVSYVGIATIFVHDIRADGQTAVLLGTVLVLAAAVLYAVFQIFAKPMIDCMGSGLFNSIAMAAAGPAVILHFLLTHSAASIAVPPGAFLPILSVAMLATVIPSYCTASAIGMIGSERTAIVGNLSPIITIALAIAILGETFTIYHAVGAALVCVGVMLFSQRAKAAAPVPMDLEP